MDIRKIIKEELLKLFEQGSELNPIVGNALSDITGQLADDEKNMQAIINLNRYIFYLKNITLEFR